MPRYVILMNWTELGATRRHDLIARARGLDAVVESVGGTIRERLFTVGGYDLVMVAEFADDETEAIAVLRLAAQGDVRTTSMRAFTAEEIGALTATLTKLEPRARTASRDSSRPSRDSSRTASRDSSRDSSRDRASSGEPGRRSASELTFWPPDA